MRELDESVLMKISALAKTDEKKTQIIQIPTLNYLFFRRD